MHTSPSVSVLMSVRNGLPFVISAVESILEQSFSDFEFLIIDDGSTDGTGEWLGTLGDKRVRVLQREGTGLTGALNYGLQQCTGRFIARMDSDDISLPTRIERQVCFLEEHPHVGILGSWAEIIDTDGHRLGTGRPPTGCKEIQIQLLLDNTFFHSALMFRAEYLRRIDGYDNALAYAQDYDLALRLMEHCQLGNLPEILHKWRFNRQAGISYTRQREQAEIASQISLRACTRHFAWSEEERRWFLRLRRLWARLSVGLEGGDIRRLGNLVTALPPTASGTSWMEFIAEMCAYRHLEAVPVLLRAAHRFARFRQAGFLLKALLKFLAGPRGMAAIRAFRPKRW